MRKLVLVLGLLPLLLVRCGGPTECACIGIDAGAPDGSPTKLDASGDAPSDAGGDVVVVTDAGDAGGLACTSPAACGTGSPVCCGTVVLSGGTPPNCTATSITSACAAQCTTAFVSNCNGTETVRLCEQAADCSSDPTNDKCCTFTSNNQSLTFCASQAIANGAGATCK
jgi:hypothetical protein